ncbi:ectonucleotide pyrophosphatase/phosphodiesterase [Rubrivirga sp.]|uniref:alkaline phosphatase family protein n=1 Tax=Rubrivirga sp. TaxID=1885344 RepID=UPI003C768780
MTLRRLLSSLLLVLFGLVVIQQLHGCAAPAPVLEAEAPERTLVLVSLDGFRHDYLDRDVDAPTLRWVAEGVRADRLVPVFPTKTFPNHYSLVTGLHPERHGIVGNSMRDPERLEGGEPARFSLGNRDAVTDGRWWSGEPIWVTAERQGVSTATIFWPGSESEIGGLRPTTWLVYDGEMPYLDRVDTALEAVDGGAGFVTLYFEAVDDAGHRYGPDAPQVAEAIARVDDSLEALVDGLRDRGRLRDVDIVVVSDHGMTPVSRDDVVFFDDALDPEDYDVDWGEVPGVWPRADQDADAIVAALDALPHVRAFRKEDVPARLRYRDNVRIPPVVVLLDEGWTLTSRDYFERRTDRPSGGTHGFDNQYRSMSGIFLARGPRFRSGLEVDSLQTVDVYGIMTAALGLEAAPNDGDATAPTRVLR